MPNEYTKIVELFRLGTDEWNNWVRENKEASFTFEGETFEGKKFVRYSFPRSVAFQSCRFENVIFEGCQFQELRFVDDCELEKLQFLGGDCFLDCEFMSVSVNSLFIKDFAFRNSLRLEASKLIEAEFSGGSIRDLSVRVGSECKMLSFFNSSVKGADFLNLKCKTLLFMRGNLNNAIFMGAEIEYASFDETNINLADFSDAKFGKASFAKGQKLERLSFDNTEFAAPPDFALATYINDHPPSFAYTRVGFPAKSSDWKIGKRIGNLLYRLLSLTEDKKAAAKFRILRSLASDNQDHQKELEFFAQEQRAKVGTEETNRLWWGVSWFFDLVSGFGQSIIRPILWWVILGLLFRFIVYPGIFQLHQGLACFPDQYARALGIFTYSHMVPLIITLDERTADFIEACTSPAVSSFWFTWAPVIHSALSTILIFLFFLGIRNRFKIR